MKFIMIMLMTLGLCLVGYSRDLNKAAPEQNNKQKTKMSEDKGIGPVTSVKLGPIDQTMAKKGKSIFQSKCMVCHNLDQRVVGPPLRDVTQIRTPEFIMNMLLNTTEMEQKDPIVKKLLDEYHVPMTNLNLNKEQARSVLEYLRSVAPAKKEK